jgi:hypothetical protein
MRNPRNVEYVKHIFGSDLVLAEDEDSMVVKLLQATVPPLALHLLVYYEINGDPSYVAEVPIELKTYTSVSDLATEIQTKFSLYQVVGFSTLDTYIQASTAGGRIRLTSTLGLPVTDPYVYKIKIQSITAEKLIGITLGEHSFPATAPNRIDATTEPDFDVIPPAVYIHTDLNSTYKNLDNVETPLQFDRSDIFAKMPYVNPNGGSYTYFYDSSYGFELNIKTGTLSSLNFYITDLNRSILHPQKEWGMCCEVEMKKRESYNDVITNNLLSRMVEYLKLMWLSVPPNNTLRKGLM